jgi:uncharacterized protein
MNKHFFAAILIAVALGPTLLAQPSPAPATTPVAEKSVLVDPEKEKMIRQMMELTQTTHLADQMMVQTIASLKGSLQGVPEEFWTKFQSKLDLNDLQNRMVAIYDKHFTKQDLQAVLDFYKTKAGQKMIGETPALLRESITAGQEWSRKVGREVVQELDAGGYLKKSSPAPAASASGKPAGNP